MAEPVVHFEEWTTSWVGKAGKRPETGEMAEPKFNTLMKNQGVYNGFIGAALLYAAYFASAPKELALVLLINILVVAAYGAVTSDKAILVKQGGLPFLALLSLFF